MTERPRWLTAFTIRSIALQSQAVGPSCCTQDQSKSKRIHWPRVDATASRSRASWSSLSPRKGLPSENPARVAACDRGAVVGAGCAVVVVVAGAVVGGDVIGGCDTLGGFSGAGDGPRDAAQMPAPSSASSTQTTTTCQILGSPRAPGVGGPGVGRP